MNYSPVFSFARELYGKEKPEFSIRGLNPRESLNRHTKEQIIKLIDRMGRWRMNTIIIHLS